MSLQQQYKTLIESETFIKWQKLNGHCYLAHAFVMLDAENNGEWQFGFYNNETDMMTTFFMDARGINHSPETEIFKHEESKVNELSIDKLKVGFDDALKMSDNFLDKDYHGEIPIKKIFILQMAESLMVWNISYLTAKFNVLNIRIDASNKKVIEHKKVSMMDFVSSQKGGLEDEEDIEKEIDQDTDQDIDHDTDQEIDRDKDYIQ